MQTVMTYDPASTGALAYREAAREMAERWAAREKVSHIPVQQDDEKADIGIDAEVKR
jgi:chromosome partitioning protein